MVIKVNQVGHTVHPCACTVKKKLNHATTKNSLTHNSRKNEKTDFPYKYSVLNFFPIS